MMYLILQGTRIQVLILKPCKSVQEPSKKVMSIKSRQISRHLYLLRFNIQSSTDISTAVSIENYEIQISRSVFHTCPSYLCKVFFSHNPRHI